MRYRWILAFVPLVFVSAVAVEAGCDGPAEVRDCTRAEVEEGGCELCPVTCHNYDDAGDADASDADAGDAN